jgi:hypothetical protein
MIPTYINESDFRVGLGAGLPEGFEKSNLRSTIVLGKFWHAPNPNV